MVPYRQPRQGLTDYCHFRVQASPALMNGIVFEGILTFTCFKKSFATSSLVLLPRAFKMFESDIKWNKCIINYKYAVKHKT